MNLIKKLIASLAAVCLLLAPACAFAEEATVPALLTIGDVQVMAEGELKQTGGEGWNYDSATNTLTLNGAAISAYKENDTGIAALYCTGDLYICDAAVNAAGDETAAESCGLWVMSHVLVNASAA